MTAYYNEWDPYCAQWLRNLIHAGLIAPGDVDERSIGDVRPNDLAGYEQVHLFAGIGGFALACRWAGHTGPIWSGGFPCQPFSTAGAGRRYGAEHDAYLWPEMLRLIRACRPEIIVCENVAGFQSMALGSVVSDMEACKYTVEPPFEIPSCAVGRDHRRARYWVCAHTDLDGKPCIAVDAEVAELPQRHCEPRVLRGKNGLSPRMAQLRAFGNAVDPRVAAEVIKACLEVRPA